MERDCVWLLHSLWRAGLLFPPKVPLPDTLLADSTSLSGLKWLFTDKRGVLKRKHQDHCAFDQVLRKFTNSQPRDAVVASLISRNEFRSLTVFQFEDYLRQGPLSLGSALQLLHCNNVDATWRYVLTMRLEDNKPHFKYEAVRVVEGKRTSAALTAQSLCTVLREVEKEVRTAVESHSKIKILRIRLVFLPDSERGVWLLGSEECLVQTQDSLTRNLTPNEERPPRLRTSSSVRKPPRSARKDWPEQPSVSSQASTYLGVRRRNACPGDFCKAVLAIPSPLKKTEADVDDLVARIKRVNSSEGQKEATKFRLSLATDFLQQERAKLQSEQRGSAMSSRYLLLGKKLLAREGLVAQDLCEVDLSNLLRHTDLLRELGEDPQQSAFHFYSEVQVCDHCYAVYSLIRMAAMKDSRTRLKSATPKRQSTSPPPNVKEGCYVSPLGRMHKHSLNDMLVDLAHQRAESENQQAPNTLKSRLLEMYKGMTLEEGRRTQQLRELEAERQRPLLDAHLQEPGSVEEMGRKLFPTNNRQALTVQAPAERSLTQWKTFLQRRRRQSRDVV